MFITHIAFDIDGVIYSAEDFIGAAYKKAIEESGLNLPIPSTERIMKQIGKPIREIFSNLFPGITEQQMTEFRKWTRKNVVQMVSEKRGIIYEGIPELILRLSKNFTLSACSNGGAGYIETILETYSLSGSFMPVLTLDSEDVSNKTGLLKSYISKNGSDSSKWVMIGDRKTDLEAAFNNNCRFIGCAWGHAHLEELVGADKIVSEPAGIITALDELQKI